MRLKQSYGHANEVFNCDYFAYLCGKHYIHPVNVDLSVYMGRWCIPNGINYNVCDLWIPPVKCNVFNKKDSDIIKSELTVYI